MDLLVSHLGYGLTASKAVIARGPVTGAVLQDANGAVVARLEAGPAQQVDNWHLGPYARLELPADLPPGAYTVQTDQAHSATFVVADHRQQTMSDVLSYFKAMRSSGEIDRKDRQAALWGDTSGRTVDARGGWLDASGDTSKFLSHLTYTSTMSPQQIPLCVWAMAAAHEATTAPPLRIRLRDEALWGADFLYRFRAPEGYFYTGIFDALTKRLDERFITAPLPDCVRTPRYQAGYRQGGGLAIAALARASQFDDDGDFTRSEYLDAAVQAFEHLERHNVEYLFDGVESIVDDYCALLAATELVAAGVSQAEEAAHRRARQLMDRYVRPAEGPGWFRADDRQRPFFHAAEAGLPILALLRYGAVLGQSEAEATALQAMRDTVARTQAVPNPFGYARQRIQPENGEPRDAFFFPHANETGYWWQGENATICSLAAAANACAALEEDAGLREFAEDQLAWVGGRNPFDVSMLHGQGRNNADYTSHFPNIPGGIVNGITSGWTDERDIAFLPAEAPEGDAWRWAEQWIPHTGWFLLAVATSR